MNRIGKINMGSPMDDLSGAPKTFEPVVGNDRKQVAREDMTFMPAAGIEGQLQSREAVYALMGRRGLRNFDKDVPIPEHRSAQPGRAAHAGVAPWSVQ